MKILFISLGCDKNLVDSEVMLGLLTKHGYTLTDDETQADVIVINTCCFIHDAKEESINTILEMAQYKEQNLKALVVAGCLAERYKDEILKEIPEIDAVLGTTSYDSIVEAVNTALEENAGEHFEHYESIDYLPDNSNVERVVTTGNHMAYLKIAEGCDKRCSYCIIPKIRGHFRSVPMEELLNEAKRLASEGVKELVLVAQETTLYGKDLTGEKQLPLLLHELCKIEGIEWIRLLYCYPEEITDELLQELELTREDVENGRNAALIKEKSETTETDEYGNVISSGTTAETDEYGNVISSGTTAETDEYGNVISSGTTSGSTSSATGTTDAQTSQTDAYGNVISGSDSTTQGTTDDEGSAFHSNIPAPLQSQDSGDGVSTQDWITNEKLGIDENNNSY